MLGRIVHRDCLDYMKSLDTQSVDLIVTDPPYEIEDMRPYFDEMLRVLKTTGSLYCFGDKRMVARHWFSQLKMPEVDLLVWYYKNSPKPKGRWRMSMQACIYGYSKESPFFEDEVRIDYQPATKKLHGRVRPSNGRLSESKPYDTSKGALPRDVLEQPALLGHLSKLRFGHPDQKPIELIERLIKASSRPEDVVFDPFAGTGTTIVAAQRLGRRGLGCELTEKWFEVAAKRIRDEHVAQSLLLTPLDS